MFRSGVRRPVRVPPVTTIKGTTKDFEFVKGFNSNLANDDVPVDQLRLASDNREVQIGKHMTRQGSDLFSIPIGEAVNVSQASITGASNQNFSTNTYFAQKLVATSTGRLTALEVNIRNTASGTGTVVLALYRDNSGAPGTEIFRTTIAANMLTSSYQYLKARSISCPDITNGTTYWVVGFVQDSGTNSYQISTTTTASTGAVSTDSGQTWTSQSFAFNVKLSTGSNHPVKGHIRVKRPGGAKVTFVAVNDTLYTVNEATGATTSVDTGLDTAATYCRFAFVNDTLYYVQGTTKPRKYDFAAASLVTNAPENAANVIAHKGILFYLSADDPTKCFFTNFGIYDTFTSTDFFYVPSPKTSDPAIAMSTLTGNMYITTRNSKYTLYGTDNSTFRLDNAVGQKGTFSQVSQAYDQDHIFLASDDGIYEFNGTQETNITTDVLDWWEGLENRANTILELHNNRLYVFYTPNGQSQNTNCKIYNILYGVWESDDTNMYVATTYTRYDTDNYLLLGSNRVGMLMQAELSTNDYTNMGEPLSWELRTNYNHYGTPAQYKRAPMYRPHFDTVTASYTVQCGYATDYSDSPTFANISLSGSGPRFDAGYTFNSGVRFGGSQQVNPLDNSLVIPGEWRRLQIRVRHYAAREPVSFDGHVLQLETQRVI